MDRDERAIARAYPDGSRMREDVAQMAAAGRWVGVLIARSDGLYRVEYDAGPVLPGAPSGGAR